jgi:hypothetical protein
MTGTIEMYMVQLDSMEYKKLEGEFTGNAYYPFARIYTGGKHFFFCLHYICMLHDMILFYIHGWLLESAVMRLSFDQQK